MKGTVEQENVLYFALMTYLVTREVLVWTPLRLDGFQWLNTRQEINKIKIN